MKKGQKWVFLVQLQGSGQVNDKRRGNIYLRKRGPKKTKMKRSERTLEPCLKEEANRLEGTNGYKEKFLVLILGRRNTETRKEKSKRGI